MECSNYERNWFHLCFTSAKCAVREACLQHKSAATVKTSGCLSDDTQLDDKRLQSGILAWFNKHELSRTDNLILTGTISWITWICWVGLSRKCQKQSIFRITHSILGEEKKKRKKVFWSQLSSDGKCICGMIINYENWENRAPQVGRIRWDEHCSAVLVLTWSESCCSSECHRPLLLSGHW